MTSNRGKSQSLRIVREALEHVRYDPADGFTPKAVAEAFQNIERDLAATERCWCTACRGWHPKVPA